MSYPQVPPQKIRFSYPPLMRVHGARNYWRTARLGEFVTVNCIVEESTTFNTVGCKPGYPRVPIADAWSTSMSRFEVVRQNLAQCRA